MQESLGKENHHLLPCRSHIRSETVGRHQRVFTAPMSKAKALLMTKEGHALRMHQVIYNVSNKINMEFIKATKATATGTSINKRYNMHITMATLSMYITL